VWALGLCGQSACEAPVTLKQGTLQLWMLWRDTPARRAALATIHPS
jgi:hypothetical protein